jgi:hypothetical protein
MASGKFENGKKVQLLSQKATITHVTSEINSVAEYFAGCFQQKKFYVVIMSYRYQYRMI